ncbi:integrase core domain protein-like protein, partial [Leptotrombidium deliense]
MFHHVVSFVSACEICAKVKPRNKAQFNVPQLIPLPTESFEAFNLDIAGPLANGSKGRKFFIIAVDRFSKFTEAKALNDITAQSVINFIQKRICLRYGSPKVIITDNGTQFIATEVEMFLASKNIKHFTTTTYHPEGNGAAERAIRTLKQTLTALCKGKPGNWERSLPYAVFAINTSYHEATGKSPFETLYGRTALVPTDLRLGRKELIAVGDSGNAEDKIVDRLAKVQRHVAERLNDTQQRHLSRILKKNVPVQLKAGQLVMLNMPHPQHKTGALQFKYHGPYRVLTQVNKNCYELEACTADNKGNVFRGIVHIKYMKPTHSVGENVVEESDSDSEVYDNPKDSDYNPDDSEKVKSKGPKRPRGRPR